jgi:hypothetical protein
MAATSPRPRRADLTPAQHAQIRRQLVLLPVYIWLMYGWSSFFVRLPGIPGADAHVFRDFAHFYVQGVIANERNTHALYDIDEQAAVLRRVVPGSPDSRFPPVHGPQVSLFFSPLARLPYVAAMSIWLGLTLLVYGWCGYRTWKACPRLRDQPWTVFWLLVAAPALRFDLGFAQTAAIGLACVTCGFLALRAERPFLAGLAVGALAYKPQLGLAAAFVLLVAREWRIVAGAATAVVGQFAVGCLYWGPGILRQYIGALRRLPDVLPTMEPLKFDMHSWRSFFELLGLPPSIALGAYAIAAAGTLAVALCAWWTRGPLGPRYAVLLVATVLVNPHMWVYDFIMLTPAFLLLWDWALGLGDRRVGDVFPRLLPATLRRQPLVSALVGLLYFCYFSPLLGALAEVDHVQASVPALFILGLGTVQVLRSAPSPAQTA